MFGSAHGKWNDLPCDVTRYWKYAPVILCKKKQIRWLASQKSDRVEHFAVMPFNKLNNTTYILKIKTNDFGQGRSAQFL